MENFDHEHFQWTHIGGRLKWISSGRNVVVGVNSGNNIYYRTGMSAGKPTGSRWKHIGGKLTMIEIYENEVVGTNSRHAIYKCPVSGVSAPKQTKPKRPSKPSKPSKPSRQFCCLTLFPTPCLLATLEMFYLFDCVRVSALDGAIM